MRKLFFILSLLLCSLTSLAQGEHEVLYGKTFKNDVWKAEKTLLIFKEDLSSIKILNVDSGIKRELIRTSDYERSKTDGGYSFLFAMYSDVHTKTPIMFQIFEDEVFGVRLIYSDGSSVQYAEELWMPEQ